jgi:hypothetical protein
LTRNSNGLLASSGVCRVVVMSAIVSSQCIFIVVRHRDQSRFRTATIRGAMTKTYRSGPDWNGPMHRTRTVERTSVGKISRSAGKFPRCEVLEFERVGDHVEQVGSVSDLPVFWSCSILTHWRLVRRSYRLGGSHRWPNSRCRRCCT